jgi:hypothetical protein
LGLGGKRKSEGKGVRKRGGRRDGEEARSSLAGKREAERSSDVTSRPREEPEKNVFENPPFSVLISLFIPLSFLT